MRRFDERAGQVVPSYWHSDTADDVLDQRAKWPSAVVSERKSLMLLQKLSNAEYHARPELGSSTLKLLDREGPEYVAASIASKPESESRALVIGSAVHAVMDGTFESSYSVAPDSYKTADSVKFAEFCAGQDRPVLTYREAAEVRACGEALRSKIGQSMVGKTCHVEASLFWQQQTASYFVPCKCRPDLLIEDDSGGVTYVEIKTAASSGQRAWRSACWSFGYWLQQAHYEAGILASGAKSVRTVFAVVRKSAPHDVRCYEFSSDDKAAAETQWMALVEEYGRRVASGDWLADTLAQPTEIALGLRDTSLLEGFDDD